LKKDCVDREVFDVEHQLGMLDVLPEKERDALISLARSVWFPKASYLYHEGQIGESLYIIGSGRVGIWIGGERGRPTLINTMGPTEVLGEMAILGSERTRTASVQALTDVRALQFDARDIHEVLDRRPRVYLLFIDILVKRVQRLTNQVGEYADLDGPTRVYRQLCAMADTGETVGQTTTLPLAQHHLASLAAVSLRLASDVLSKARDDGLLQTGRGEIIVLDWQGVRRRAGLSRRK
jgi:CRP/FNR family transcriptional regulator, cyclic AMP receptor protein